MTGEIERSDMGKPKIILEYALEVHAAELNAWQCRDLADVYVRWAHQLRVKAKMMEQCQQPLKRQRLKRLPVSEQRLN
jgi:hypothetical protein